MYQFEKSVDFLASIPIWTCLDSVVGAGVGSFFADGFLAGAVVGFAATAVYFY